MHKYDKTIFLLHRDLRLVDNTGLIAALNCSREVAPVFIFDPIQVGEQPYRSKYALGFMVESLAELAEEVQAHDGALSFFYGPTLEILEKIFAAQKIQAVFSSRDYTPFAMKRDQNIASLCKKNGIQFELFSDVLLHEPEEVTTQKSLPYTVFSPFYRRLATLKVREPAALPKKGIFSKALPGSDSGVIDRIERTKGCIPGGRKVAVAALNATLKLDDYSTTRDFPEHPTSRLSAHLKFGTCSVREVYHKVSSAFGPAHSLLRELGWRDFFYHIAFHFPHVFGGSFTRRFDALEWDYDEDRFGNWCAGNTGFPLVDAGMRELSQSGFMHNRARLVTASFLVKDLHIDWRWGELTLW